ncbi:uncharacterized protein LOC114362952 [Ostrinia furnacalis]|uniref:uncharacterized protein LOC114362952 n=1 Tax=Ostrinia furnacalis TaxID=93504 RepID=UPI0010394B66|nr:uncharacterized protein LOC114362952 [Ostrinia furnacalis]
MRLGTTTTVLRDTTSHLTGNICAFEYPNIATLSLLVIVLTLQYVFPTGGEIQYFYNFKAIILAKGDKKYFMYKGYTYTLGFMGRNSQRWRCTNTHNCRAYILVTHQEQFLDAFGDHNHSPPRYHVTSDGKYLRI